MQAVSIRMAKTVGDDAKSVKRNKAALERGLISLV